MPAWLTNAWGKFRNWQHVCASPQRLDPGQKRAAWCLWDLMRRVEASDGDDEAMTDRLHEATIEMVKSMPSHIRKGPKVFAAWLVENRKALAAPPVVRNVAEAAQTTDTVSAQLIR